MHAARKNETVRPFAGGNEGSVALGGPVAAMQSNLAARLGAGAVWQVAEVPLVRVDRTTAVVATTALVGGLAAGATLLALLLA